MSIRLLPPEQRVIRKITDRYRYLTRDVFLTAARKAFDQVDLASLATVLAAGPELQWGRIYAKARIQTLIGEFEVNLQPLIDRLLLRAGDAGLPVFAETFGVLQPDFSTFQRLAERASNEIVAEAVTNVSRSTKAAIRAIVGDGFEQGLSPAKIAKQIQETVGLDERRARGFEAWIARLQANPPDVNEAALQRMINREYRRRLRSRAMAIARTESSAAAAAAQNLIWESAIEEGQISETDYVREWIRIPAAKPCPICGPLRGRRARIRGYYVAPDGTRYFRPPGHTNCLCGERLVLWNEGDEELPLAA